jgi:hypothetical protein
MGLGARRPGLDSGVALSMLFRRSWLWHGCGMWGEWVHGSRGGELQGFIEFVGFKVVPCFLAVEEWGFGFRG